MRPVLAHDFAERASPAAMPERMDAETDYETFRATVASLASVNRLTMGYRPQRRFLDAVLDRNLPGVIAAKSGLRVLDVGFGYGDTTRAVAETLDASAREAAEAGRAEVVGVDLNPHARRAAEEVTPDYAHVDVRYETADVFEHVKHAAPYDLIVSALFTHHLEDAEIVRFLRWMDETAAIGWLVNDLWRWKPAALGFGALASLLGKHAHVRHDGPVSFARSFRRHDWDRLLAEAGVEGADVAMLAPFRLCVMKHG